MNAIDQEATGPAGLSLVMGLARLLVSKGIIEKGELADMLDSLIIGHETKFAATGSAPEQQVAEVLGVMAQSVARPQW